MPEIILEVPFSLGTLQNKSLWREALKGRRFKPLYPTFFYITEPKSWRNIVALICLWYPLSSLSQNWTLKKIENSLYSQPLQAYHKFLRIHSNSLIRIFLLMYKTEKPNVLILATVSTLFSSKQIIINGDCEGSTDDAFNFSKEAIRRLSDSMKNLTLLWMTFICSFAYILLLFWDFFLSYPTSYKAPIIQFLVILVLIISVVFKDLAVFSAPVMKFNLLYFLCFKNIFFWKLAIEFSVFKKHFSVKGKYQLKYIFVVIHHFNSETFF